MLALLSALALARGGYWALVTEIWSPIDEAQHFAYVESLATGAGIPTVGRDLVSPDVTALAKASSTFLFRGSDVSGEPADPRWGPFDDQYEGVQGPPYYALMTPFYWAGRPFGVISSVYAVRFGTVLLGALAVPLTALLARRLFPDRVVVSLLAPLLLVVLNGFNGTTGAVSNDALVITGSALALVLFLRARDRASPRAAAVAGVVAGAVLVGKTTAVGLFGLCGLALALDPRWRRGPGRPRLAWCGAFVCGAALAGLPWLAWNLHAYGALSGAEQAGLLTGAAQETFPRDLDTLARQVDAATSTFWESQLTPSGAGYPVIWYGAVLGAAAGGIALALRRRRRGTAPTLVWLAAAFPVAFVGVVGVFFVFFEEAGLVRGRYLYSALVPIVVLLAAGIVEIVGSRWAPAVAVGIATAALQVETGLVHRYVQLSYEFGLIFEEEATYAPVVDQSWADQSAVATAVAVDMGCPVRFVGLRLVPAPATIVVTTAARAPVTAPGEASASTRSTTGTVYTTQPGDITVYELDTPVEGALRVGIPAGTRVGTSATEREARLALVGAPGDPVARVYCPVADAEDLRYEQRFDAQHASVLSRTMVRGWPRFWTAAAVVATGWAVVAARRGRQVDRDGVSPWLRP